MNKHIKRKLLIKAQAKGMCDKGLRALYFYNGDKDGLIDLYFKFIDFCIVRNYPGNKFIKKHFYGVAQRKGIFVDDDINITNYGRIVTLGNTKGEININNFCVSTMYLTQDSVVSVYVKEQALASIDVLHNARVNIIVEDGASVLVNKYAGENKVKCYGSKNALIKVIEHKEKHYKL